jgi:hypothetical protein
MVNGLNPAAAQQQAIVNPFQQRLDAQVRSTGKDDDQTAAKPDAKQSVGTSFSSPESVTKFSVSEDSSNRSSRGNQERGSLVDITV